MVSDKPKLMLTGAGGLLGYALCRAARKSWTVHGIYRRYLPMVDGVHAIQADLEDATRMESLLHTIQPQVVIHAAANADVNACENDPQQFESINTQVPARLARLCARAGIGFVFTSTDLVFDGRQAPYCETDPVGPICVYGRQKADAERRVLDHHPNALVCRLPLMYGAGPHARRHFVVRMLQAIRSNRVLNLFIDEYRTPVDVDSAAEGMLALLGQATGLLHLGGFVRLSRYELGLALARQLNADPGMIHPVCIADIPLAVSRAPDCSLVSDKAYAAGYQPAALAVGLQRFVARYDRLFPEASVDP